MQVKVAVNEINDFIACINARTHTYFVTQLYTCTNVHVSQAGVQSPSTRKQIKYNKMHIIHFRPHTYSYYTIELIYIFVTHH